MEFSNKFIPVLYVKTVDREFTVLPDDSIYTGDDPASLYQIHKLWRDTTFLHEQFNSYMIWTGCNKGIKPLENLDLTEKEIKNFKAKGLAVYLYEPFSNYVKNKPLKCLEHDWYDHYETEDYAVTDLRAFELDALEQFREKHGLNSIVVYTCEGNVVQYYQEQYPKLKLHTKDIFLSENSYTSDVTDLFWQKQPHKRFCHLSYRYTGVRHLMTGWLAGMRNFPNSNISWSVGGFLNNLNEHNRMWFDVKKWALKNDFNDQLGRGFNRLEKHLPLSLDQKFPVRAWINDPNRNVVIPRHDNFDARNYIAECFMSVVSESRFAQPTANFSEKTINVIKARRPFILVAPPKTLQYMHSLGFKTFGRFWDESYDTELNHQKRLVKIFRLIKFFDDLEDYECWDLLEKIKPVLQWNHERLLQFGTHPYEWDRDEYAKLDKV